MLYKKIIFIIILVVLVLGILYGVSVNSSRNNLKCPNDYATAGEYVDGTAKWIQEEMKMNPNLSQEKILEKRTQELEANRCEKSYWL